MKLATLYRNLPILIAAMILAAAWPANRALAAEQAIPVTIHPSSIPVDQALPTARSRPLELLPPIQPGQSKAARWLQLLDETTAVETWQKQPACNDKPARDRTGLCRLQWRKQGGLSTLRGRYDDYSYGLTRRLAGQHLADHLEFDVDRSPEVRLRYEFD